ncbi:MAG: 3-isopropylmalate dehydrogenase, partial [Rhodothermales bacterium]|nr:3-isopropylmalate dehydrogenase [Rhodothermales bacterium]
GTGAVPGHDEQAVNTMRYSRPEVERIAVIGMREAGRRSGRVTSVDKANVLEVSRLWRDVVGEVHADYPDVELSHMYVDNAAMQLVLDPAQFDVILTGNLFGDILSDLAAALVGSLGVLPSASLGGRTPVFEPVHGSAPDLAVSGRPNPVGAILSGAMLLEHAGHTESAESIRRAVRQTLADGTATPDLGGTASSDDVTNSILQQITKRSVATT